MATSTYGATAIQTSVRMELFMESGSVVTVTTECHYLRTPEGVYTKGVEDYDFLRRYLDGFEKVRVAARVCPVSKCPESDALYRRADGPNVEFFDLPDFRGAAGLIRKAFSVCAELCRLVCSRRTAFILRAPGVISSLVWMVLQFQRRPFGVEVVTDPAEAYRSDALGSRLAPVVRPLSVWVLRRQCATAIAVSYVTREALQRRYPPLSPHVFHYSSVDLRDDIFERSRDVYARLAGQPQCLVPGNLLFVGHLDRPFKGLDTLLKALSQMRAIEGRGGVPNLMVVGDGELRNDYESLSCTLDIEDQVIFVGALPPGDPVFELMAEADLLVHPSRREGLPRVIIEAMAVGLPCICSNVSGASELLAPDDIVPMDRPSLLATKISELLGSRHRRLEASRRNSDRAKDYSRSKLQARRRAFFHAFASNVSV